MMRDGAKSKLAWVAGCCGCFGLGWVLLGLVLRQLGWIEAMQSFTLFYQLGSLCGLLALLLGGIGLYTTRTASGRSGRRLALFGVATGGVLVVALLAALLPVLRAELPTLNDISTDLENPPRFASDPSGRGRDMTYPPPNYPPNWREQIRAAWPALAPIESAHPPTHALELAARTARQLGWQVTHVDEAAGIIQAQHSTRLFRFVDDVVIRVRADAGGGARLDLRSKSRDGRGDLGANAARIQRFRDAYRRAQPRRAAPAAQP